jgi:N-acyl-D-aspartate/D-glutamate deacylase
MSGKKLTGAALAITFVAAGVAGAVIAAPTVSAAYDGGSDYRTEDGGTRPPLRHDRFGRGPLTEAAKAIGISEDELVDQLKDGKSIADVAKAKGKDPADVVDAIVAKMSERIDQAVKDGKVDGDEAAERRKDFADAAERIVNRSGLPERDGRHFGAPGRPALDVAAKTIGISEDELVDQLKDGKSIADVAKAKGKDPADVVDAMVAEMSTRLDQAVKDGKLTADEAKQRKDHLKDMVTRMVNGEGPLGRGDRPDRPGRPGSGDRPMERRLPR